MHPQTLFYRVIALSHTHTPGRIVPELWNVSLRIRLLSDSAFITRQIKSYEEIKRKVLVFCQVFYLYFSLSDVDAEILQGPDKEMAPLTSAASVFSSFSPQINESLLSPAWRLLAVPGPGAGGCEGTTDFPSCVVSLPPCFYLPLPQRSKHVSERRLKVNAGVYSSPLMLAAPRRLPLLHNSSTCQFNLGFGATQRGLRCFRGESVELFLSFLTLPLVLL